MKSVLIFVPEVKEAPGGEARVLILLLPALGNSCVELLAAFTALNLFKYTTIRGRVSHGGGFKDCNSVRSLASSSVTVTITVN